MTWEEARLRIGKEETSHELLLQGDARSAYYYPRFLQGATLTPRPLWCVEVDDSASLNAKVPRLKTSDYAYKSTKEENWKVRLKGPVEKEFVFSTVIGEDLLPFVVRQLRMYVLPVVVNEGRFHTVSHGEILALGFDKASDWVKKAEHIWSSRANGQSMTAQQRLDFQHLLTNQRPNEPHIVLYNASGTNISCAYLSVRDRQSGELAGFVADTVTYCIYCDSESEAHYVVGVLNSNVVNDAIKPYQPEGVFHGARHIHRRPLEVCPIEQFDPENPLHEEIARLAKVAKTNLANFQMDGSLAKVRESARDRVRDEITAIDALVAQMFKAAPIKSQKLQPGHQSGMFGD